MVVADHDNKTLSPGTLNTITAASQLGDVEVLVAGDACGNVASAVAKVNGVKKVITVESADLKEPRAERLSEVSSHLPSFLMDRLYWLSKKRTNTLICLLLLLPTAKISSQGWVLTWMCNLSGTLSTVWIGLYSHDLFSEVQQILGEDTFVRPIYAGNALMTLKSKDAVKVMTVR